MDTDNICMLVGETFGLAVIDTGCPKTVCGTEWLNVYVDSLSSKDRNHIRSKKSSNRFRFGDGQMYKSQKRVTIPIFVGNNKHYLNVDVVDICIPLLISRETLERASARIDVGKNTISFVGTEVPLVNSSSGHLCLPIGRSYDHCDTPSTKVLNSYFSSPFGYYSDEADLKQKALKLHKQFAHPLPEKLIRLIENSGVNDPKVANAIKDVSSQCDVCKRFKKRPLKPAVGFPLASQFNQTVAMDLKQFGDKYMLHMVDHLSRYSAACIIDNKRKETIVNGIMEHWVRIFGSPNKFLSDNGGEFINKEFMDLAEKYNITIMTTAAESAWSNGLVERHNGLLANMINKVRADVQDCPLEIAVHWACAAKNSLSNVYGFSPNIIVFGRNPNYPSVLANKPPGNNMECISEYIAQNLNAMHSARQAFIQQESSEKLRRALNRKSRTYSDSVFCLGDSVYYWREKSDSCHGPATVVGKDHQQILIKHGGSYLRIHPCRLQHCLSPTSNPVSTQLTNPIANVSVNEQQNASEEQVSSDESETEPQNHITEDTSVPAGIDNWTKVRTNHDLPKPKSNIECLFPGHDSAITCKVLSRGGRSTTPNWHYLNIIEENDHEGKCCSFKEVSWRPAAIADQDAVENQASGTNSDSNEEETFYGSVPQNEQLYEIPKQEEIQKWRDFNTFVEVPNEGQPTVSTRWVCTRKFKGNKVVTKARLVARGFEENTDNLKTDSPTCSKECLRLLLCILSANSWTLNSLDVKSAFLQGIKMTRDVYIKPPKEANTKLLWKLLRCIYGLADAGRHWYLRIVKELSALGLIQCHYDKAIFMWYSNSILCGIIACHVDDLIFGGTADFHDTVIAKIRAVFIVGSEENTNLKYLGLKICQLPDMITLAAKDYSSSIKKVNLLQAQTNDEKVKALKQFAGQINWLVNQVRPDVAFDSCNMSNCISSDLDKALKISNKIVRKVHYQDVTLCFHMDFNVMDCKVVTFCDASFKNLANHGSQGGFIAFIIDNKGIYSPIAWQSRKVRRVVKSTIAAESLAALDAAEMSVFLVAVLKDILKIDKCESHIVCDNRSLVDSVYSSTKLEDMCLLLDVSVLRDMIEKQLITGVHWVPSDHQLADCLTKQGAPDQKLMNVLNNKLKFDFQTLSFV